MTQLEQDAKVIFIGDSITDCNRNYENPADLGNGYVSMISAQFGLRYPNKQVRFLNRGISGNRVKDLQARWQEDCLALQPDWVSIYIGINDTWRRYDSNDPTTVEDFERGYRDLLVRAKEQLAPKFILVEPFVLPVAEGQADWRADLDPKIQAVRKLAREFGTYYVPLDGLFAGVGTRVDPAFWAPDGVHPSPAGHALIAEAWLKAID